MDAHIVNFYSKEGLSLVQILTQGHDSFTYVSAASAMEQNLIQVKELDEAGSVNHLLVVNLSKQYVFMMDGDILAGAKQNRVVNTSILLPPESKTDIPVSCVESGRWRNVSADFAPTDYAAPSSLRMEKARQVKTSLKARRGFASNQGAIWDTVSRFEAQSQVSSKTSNLSDVYSRKRAEFDKFVSAFQCNESANGVAIFRGRRLLSLDAFNRRQIFREYFPKILRGVALEVCNEKHEREPLGEAEAKFRVLDFFDSFDALPWEAYKAVAAGEERRFETETLAGFVLDAGGHMIHLTTLEAYQKKV